MARGIEPRETQRAKVLLYLEDLYQKQLEILMGEPFVVKITPSADYIDDSIVLDGFEAAAKAAMDWQARHKTRDERKKERERRHRIFLTFLFQNVSRYMGMHENFVIVASRGHGATEEVHIAKKYAVLYLVRKMRTIPISTISSFLGYKNHTAILYVKRMSSALLKNDKKWAEGYYKFEKWFSDKLRNQKKSDE